MEEGTRHDSLRQAMRILPERKETQKRGFLLRPLRHPGAARKEEDMKKILEQRRTCTICGKDFYLTPGYIFKRRDYQTRKTVYFCSWHCMLEEEKRRERTKRGAGS